jgi:hypothetical protein
MELSACVFFTDDPAPYIDGVRINSPHYLCKLILNENSAHSYTLVISQYEKTNTIFYTLRAYATCPFTLAEIGSPYRHTQKVSQDSCFHHSRSKHVGQITLCVVILFVLWIWCAVCSPSTGHILPCHKYNFASHTSSVRADFLVTICYASKIRFRLLVIVRRQQ